MKVGKKVQKGISDSDKLKYTKCVEILASKQEVASSVTTGTSISFSFSFLLLYQQHIAQGSLNE